MNAIWILGATIAAYVADTLLGDEHRDKLPPWVAKLLGR